MERAQHTFTSLTYHIVFSTKARRPLLRDDFRKRAFEYMAGIVRGARGQAIAIGGIADHAHLLVGLPPSLSPADAVRLVKCNSSLWIHETFERTAGFAWQDGYAAFTVSRPNVAAVAEYVQRQVEHHKRISFADEWRKLLEAHGFSVPQEPAMAAGAE